MHEPALALARELERADGGLAAAIAEVDGLQREIDQLRGRAEALGDVLARLPERRELATTSVRNAEEELEARRAAAARAEGELAEAERSRKEERVGAARRGLERARDAVGRAETRLARAHEGAVALEREAEAAGAETPELEARARGLAERVKAVPRISAGAGGEPASGLAGTAAWASRARAALWVVRGGLEGERERIVREANELGASVLGEPVAATSVSLVRERIERGAAS